LHCRVLLRARYGVAEADLGADLTVIRYYDATTWPCIDSKAGITEAIPLPAYEIAPTLQTGQSAFFACTASAGLVAVCNRLQGPIQGGASVSSRKGGDKDCVAVDRCPI
jgi:hypothetical protein